MAPDAEALRAILKQYIGPAYDRALRNTGEPEAAKEATRRAMELLKRACMGRAHQGIGLADHRRLLQ